MILDLFGTLVTYPAGAPHVRLMAQGLGVEFERLRGAWHKLRPQRDGGELDNLAALRLCCDELGIAATAEQLDGVCEEVATFFSELLEPRDGALASLDVLRRRELLIGLVSDSNLEVARAWSSSALAPLVDAAVFSCLEHVRKPHPALYQAVCDRLAVIPADCLYVGNGDGDELSGAMRMGMRAVLYTAPGEVPGREAKSWLGPRIEKLADIADLV